MFLGLNLKYTDAKPEFVLSWETLHTNFMSWERELKKSQNVTYRSFRYHHPPTPHLVLLIASDSVFSTYSQERVLSNIHAASVELAVYLLCFVALWRPFMLLLWSGEPLKTGWWPDSSSQLWFIIIRSLAWSAGLSGIISHSRIHNCAHPGLLRDYPLIKIIHYECTVIFLLFSWSLVVAHLPIVSWTLLHLICSLYVSSCVTGIDSEREINYR